MRVRRRAWTFGLLAVLTGPALTGAASAQDGLFKGKTVQILVGAQMAEHRFLDAWNVMRRDGDPGDPVARATLGEIALRHNTTVEALLRANNLDDPNMVFVGQRLLVSQ